MAEDTFAEADEWDEPDPDWIRFFSEAELYGENSHSFRDLAYVAGRSPAYASLAEPLMRRAVELFAEDDEHQRSYALNLIGMATVHLLRREPEESTGLAVEAMGIAKKVRSNASTPVSARPSTRPYAISATSVRSSTSPSGSPSSCRRPPKRSETHQPRPRRPLPNCPTRLPHARSLGGRRGRFVSRSGRCATITIARPRIRQFTDA